METTFALYQLQRAILLEGKDFIFKRPKLDANKERVKGEYSQTFTVRGLFHVSSSPYITITNSDSAAVKTKKSPQILALWAKAKDLEQGDELEMNGFLYRVNGVDNIGELDMAGDISIEVRQK